MIIPRAPPSGARSNRHNTQPSQQPGPDQAVTKPEPPAAGARSSRPGGAKRTCQSQRGGLQRRSRGRTPRESRNAITPCYAWLRSTVLARPKERQAAPGARSVRVFVTEREAGRIRLPSRGPVGNQLAQPLPGHARSPRKWLLGRLGPATVSERRRIWSLPRR
jgi:hypothetical protein